MNGRQRQAQEMSQKFIHGIKLKSKYLFHALIILLDQKEIEPLLTWEQICGIAIEKVKEFEGVSLIEDERNDKTYRWVVTQTIMQWF